MSTPAPKPPLVDPHARRLVTFVKAGKQETQVTTAGKVAEVISGLVLSGAAPGSVEVWRPLKVRVAVEVEEV